MPEFIRARSEQQKEQRMQEIKSAVNSLFMEHPYHEITLTTIADKLNWTRANLYQYISTKEEIFLELCADKRDLYYDALISSFPEGCEYPIDVFAEVWSGILNAHKEHLYYSDILSTIIETNVSIERLGTFKRRYFEKVNEVTTLFASHLNLSNETTYQIILNVHYHAVGMSSICRCNPLVEQALKKEHLTSPTIDFKKNMKDFMNMNLAYYCKKKNT